MSRLHEFGASGDKSSEISNDLPIFNADDLESNMKVIYYSRTFLSIIGGVTAGILGFTGITGFIFYFLVMTFTSAGLIAKSKFSIPAYFDGWNRVTFDGFLSGLMSFVLFWTYPFVIKATASRPYGSLVDFVGLPACFLFLALYFQVHR